MTETIKVYMMEKPDASLAIKHYRSNRKPLLENPLVKLPLGSVKAGGWLGKQLELMREGMTGRLPELSHYVNQDKGWLTGDGYGWEELPYWFRGFHDLAILLDDKKMKTEAQNMIEAIIANQESDGYFGPKSLKEITGANGQTVADIWPHMVILDALRTYYEYSNDSRIITLMIKFLHWCESLPDERFVPPYDEQFGNGWPFIQTPRSGDMLPHIYWLYNRTGEEWLLGLAERFKKKMAPPQGEWIDRHVVNFTQRFRVAGNYYIQSKNPDDLAETEYWYEKHMGVWGQQPGGILGADEQIRDGKTDPKQACETCAMVEFNKSFYILAEVTGQTIYADRCEDIMFNSFPATHTPDLKALHYLTAANQPQLDSSGNHDYRNKGRLIDYSPGERYRCCQHNSSMGWPYYVEHLWMAAAGDGLAAWLYAESEATAVVGDGVRVNIREKTDYPFDTNVSITIYPEKAVKFPLYLRIPSWSEDTEVKLNGVLQYVKAEPGKFLVIEREWHKGDLVELNFPVKISIKRWEKTNSVTVNRGPLSYSLKIGEEWRRNGGTDEWPEWEVMPESPWNYGLILDIGKPEESIYVKNLHKVKGQPWTLENAPIELTARGRRIPGWILIDETVADLQKSPIKSDRPVEDITLVPMGCARLRISCFPTIGEGSDAKEWI